MTDPDIKRLIDIFTDLKCLYDYNNSYQINLKVITEIFIGKVLFF